MRLFDFDWTQAFEISKKWAKLGADQRDVILGVPANGAIDIEGTAHAEAIELGEKLGILKRLKGNKRVQAGVKFAAVHKAMRSMRRFAVTGAADQKLLTEYLVEILHKEERRWLTGNQSVVSWFHDKDAILRSVCHSSHPKGFLNAGSAVRQVEWLQSRSVPQEASLEEAEAGTYLETEPQPTTQIARDLSAVLTILLRQTKPIGLGELLGQRKSLTIKRLASALRAGLRHALILADLGPDHLIRIAVLPGISASESKPQLAQPQPVEPTHFTVWPTLTADLAVLLVFISQPRRIRAADDELFAKSEAELEALLGPSPAVDLGEAALGSMVRRIWRVRETAKRLGLVSISTKGPNGSKGRHLGISSKGHAWLASSNAQQMRKLAEPARASLAARGAEAKTIQIGWRLPNVTPFLTDLLAAFQSLSRPILWSKFAHYQSLQCNPLLTGGEAGGPIRQSNGSPFLDEELIDAWKKALDYILLLHLFPHGGVQIGHVADETCVRLTAPGEFILGFAAEFTVEEEPASPPAILVQADFEVIFLAPHPQLEAALAPFTERLAQGVGALFRFTKVSVQEGAYAGHDINQLLQDLAAASLSPLPTNVTSEVKRWSTSVIALSWERPLILRCPDEETALRIQTTCGKAIEQLAPLIFILNDPKKRSTVTRNCAKAGIFLEAPPEEFAPRGKRRRSSARWRRWSD